MEQKRKVKTLISKTDAWELWFLSRMLIILSCFLCLSALSLTVFFMSFVDAAWGLNYNEWLNERTEVLYKLDFVRKDDLKNVISTIEVDDKWGIDRLSITPKPVVITRWYGNDIWNYDKYVNLLWWDDLNIYSDNISIIWWSYNEVNGYNNNATIFWWKSNKIVSNNSNGVPNVIIWWENNVIWWINAVILWWESNVISWNDSFILWWTENKINAGVTNAIVAWKKVTADKRNIFVFSNDNNGFSPEKDNAFYINVQKWMWINGNASGWVVSNGAVKFWNLGGDCESSDWLIWLVGDDLKGCSMGVGRKIWTFDGNEEVKSGSFTWYCTWADYLKILVGKERYKLCWKEASTYNNVVFETKLLTWSVNCEGVSLGDRKNPCVFACAEHHSYDKTEDKCMKDCVIPGTDDVYTGHNVKIRRYTQQESTCDTADKRACDSVLLVLKCNDGKWKKDSGGGSLDLGPDWDIKTSLYETCSDGSKVSCVNDGYRYTNNNIKNFEYENQPCNDYYAQDKCIAKPYYKWTCYKNHTLMNTLDGMCETWVDTSGCGCEPNTQTVNCSWENGEEIKNTILINTWFKQTASGKNGDWYPSNMYYNYVSNNSVQEQECTYRCNTWYLYSTWNSELNVYTGCWSGCKLPWTGTIVNHGTVITGYLKKQGGDLGCHAIYGETYVNMICGTWWMRNEYRKYIGETDHNFTIYNENGVIKFKYKTCK